MSRQNTPVHGTKQGRPRRYELQPLSGFASSEVARLATGLTELHDRVNDQIADLPAEAINFVAPGTALSIGWVVTHLVVSEAGWVGRLSGSPPLSAAIRDERNVAAYTPYGTQPAQFGPAKELIALSNKAWEVVTLPALRAIESPDQATQDDRLRSVREVLMHLLWHWTFHSGHIGMIRLQWGSEYEWTF